MKKGKYFIKIQFFQSNNGFSFLNVKNMSSFYRNLNLNRIENEIIEKKLNAKPFKCPKCERSFNSKYNVARHLRQFHAEKRMYKCLVCERDYKWVDSLHKHMKTHKKNETENELNKDEKINVYNYDHK